MATQWNIDTAHSEIQFKVKHLMITTVTGYFTNFSLTAVTNSQNFATASQIEFTADINSITTNNEQRDGHLKSADFFDAEQFPQLTFSGKKYDTKNDEEAVITGDLTIKGVTQPVSFNVEFGGIVVDPYGQTKAGFTVSGKINRSAFGLTWGAVTEAGKVVVGDEIKLHAEIQLIQQA